MPVELSKQIVLNRKSGEPFVTITYEESEGFIYVDWNGYLSVEMVQEGSEELLKLFKSIGTISKVLVNNQNISGPWSKANDWYANDWNPRAITAGLKFMGVIVSPNIFTQLSLQGFVEVSNGFTVRSFNAEDKAREWLKEAE
ncbi:MAG: hypothetical protein CMO01_24550 [Thalassobius sp.]|nr:hypothetical protein [Thalassovita sp.]